MTNEEALDIMERQLECDNDNCPEPRTSCSECPYNVDAIDYARARKMAIEALSNRCASSEQAGTKPNQPEIGSIIAKTGENDEDRTTDDQCGDGARMIDLKKRTITERLIIANSLIASAISDSDNNQEVKKSSDKLIKASDAVDIVAKHSALYGDGEVSTDEGETLLYGIMSEIMNLPSAEPERKMGEWIPCSERLPKDSELVLVTYEDEFDDGSAKFPNWEIASYGVINKTWSGGGYTNLDVIAWMPLPEPYKGDSDDQQ